MEAKHEPPEFSTPHADESSHNMNYVVKRHFTYTLTFLHYTCNGLFFQVVFGKRQQLPDGQERICRTIGLPLTTQIFYPAV